MRPVEETLVSWRLMAARFAARSKEAGRRRGAIIAALRGTDVAIAAALKVSKHTVYVHRASRSEPA